MSLLTYNPIATALILLGLPVLAAHGVNAFYLWYTARGIRKPEQRRRSA